MEYRTYFLSFLWATVFTLIFGEATLMIAVAIAFWTAQSFTRSEFYKTNLAFWTQAFIESPNKLRVRLRYSEQLMLDIERRDKAGESWDSMQEQIKTASQLVTEIAEGRQKDLKSW